MSAHEVRSLLKQNHEALRKLGVSRLFLFGSALDQNFNAIHDVDLVADFERGALGVHNFFGLEALLRECLQHEIDLMTRDSLHPALKQRIEQSMQRVF